VIHRDVKPTNLFLTKTGIVKLLDLGFGELVGMTGLAGNVFDTDENIVVGTTDFMSPELVSNKAIDYRTDLFSLGCTMYRLLTGAYAFPGETREDRLVKRIREPHVPITEVRPGLSRRLVEIVDRLLASRPENRFGSAAEAAEALESLMPRADRPERAASAKPTTNAALDEVASEPSEPEQPLDWELIESALRPAGPGAPETPRLLSDDESKSPSHRRLSAHRKSLEEEGIESGREVHQQYRNELKQMKTAMLEQRSAEPTVQAPTRSDALRDAFVERMADRVSEFLVEPSPAQLFILAVVIFSAVVLALGIALR
jgi:serine/threonine protein kinase